MLGKPRYEGAGCPLVGAVGLPTRAQGLLLCVRDPCDAQQEEDISAGQKIVTHPQAAGKAKTKKATQISHSKK